MTDAAKAAAPRQAHSGQLAGIQMLRGLAALIVVLHHSWLAVTQALPHPVGQVARRLIGLGAAGVDVFFVISGLIMIHTGHLSLGRPGAAADFLARRAIRIVPLYWLLSCALLVPWMAGLLLRRTRLTAIDIACSFLFAPCVHPHGVYGTTHPLLDPGWTLSYEWYFYLVFCVLLAVGSLRVLLIGIPLLFCGVLALASQSPPGNTVTDFLSDPLVFEFCFGLGIGGLFLAGYRPPPALGAALMAGGAGLLLASCLAPAGARALGWGIPAALIVLGALAIPKPGSWFGVALVGLGDSSYALYLSHGLLMIAFSGWLEHSRPTRLTPLQWLPVLLVCAASIAIAVLLHQRVEKPLTTTLKATYDRHRSKRSARPGRG